MRSYKGFPNGRQLTDDVIDIEFGLLTNGALTSDRVGNDSVFRKSFPYLGAPLPRSSALLALKGIEEADRYPLLPDVLAPGPGESTSGAMGRVGPRAPVPVQPAAYRRANGAVVTLPRPPPEGRGKIHARVQLQ